MPQLDGSPTVTDVTQAMPNGGRSTDQDGQLHIGVTVDAECREWESELLWAGGGRVPRPQEEFDADREIGAR